MRGKIYRVYQVICATCQYDDEVQSLPKHTRKEFEQMLRREGWRKLRGVWVCGICLHHFRRKDLLELIDNNEREVDEANHI